MSEFKQYRKKLVAEMRPYVKGEDMTGVSVSDADKAKGSPKLGDMISRGLTDHNDRWLVEDEFFKANYIPV